jgi:hypothetical protein
MSEKIFACLLRIYPSGFREKYGEDVLQLYRDRFRDETGLFPRARLYFDLISDIVVGLPQAYRNTYAAVASTSLAINTDGVPSFRVLDKEPLPPGLILLGSIVALMALTGFLFVMGHPTADRSFSSSNGHKSPIEAVMQRLSQPPSPDSIDDNTVRSPNPTVEPRERAGVKNSAKASNIGLIPYTGIDLAERRRVVGLVVVVLQKDYFDHAMAQKVSKALQAHEQDGDDDGVMSGEAFADLLTRQMRDTSHDGRLVVEFSREILPDHPLRPTLAGDAHAGAFHRLDDHFGMGIP